VVEQASSPGASKLKSLQLMASWAPAPRRAGKRARSKSRTRPGSASACGQMPKRRAPTTPPASGRSRPPNPILQAAGKTSADLGSDDQVALVITTRATLWADVWSPSAGACGGGGSAGRRTPALPPACSAGGLSHSITPSRVQCEIETFAEDIEQQHSWRAWERWRDRCFAPQLFTVPAHSARHRQHVSS
jgi:hypothetical protein